MAAQADGDRDQYMLTAVYIVETLGRYGFPVSQTVPHTGPPLSTTSLGSLQGPRLALT